MHGKCSPLLFDLGVSTPKSSTTEVLVMTVSSKSLGDVSESGRYPTSSERFCESISTIVEKFGLSEGFLFQQDINSSCLQIGTSIIYHNNNNERKWLTCYQCRLS